MMKTQKVTCYSLKFGMKIILYYMIFNFRLKFGMKIILYYVIFNFRLNILPEGVQRIDSPPRGEPWATFILNGKVVYQTKQQCILVNDL